ncbi:MAG: four helix bundle protein [Opitutales bacterium]
MLNKLSHMGGMEKEFRHRPVFRFEKLDIWQETRALNRLIYEWTRSFPSEEAFGLTSQLRRASVSISSNIAEGSGRNSDADFCRFLEIAFGSLMEMVSQAFLANDEAYLSDESHHELMTRADSLSRTLADLIRSLGRNPRSKQ